MTPRATAVLRTIVPDKLDPTVLDTLPPADTFRYIAAWAEEAARCWEAGLDFPNLACEDATACRVATTSALVQVWTAIVHCGGEARSRLSLSLDAAQRLDIDQR